MNKRNLILVVCVAAFVIASNDIYGQSWKDLKNKAKQVKLGKKKKDETKAEVKNTNSSSSSKGMYERKGSAKGNSSNNNSSVSSSTSSELQTMAEYYYQKTKELRDIKYLTKVPWKNGTLKVAETFNFEGLESRIKSDMVKFPDLFMVYPKWLPETSRNGRSQENVNELTFANIAGKNDDWPRGKDESKILDFYYNYCEWKEGIQKDEKQMSSFIRKAILDAEQEKIGKFDKSKFAVKYAETAKLFYPNSTLIGDIAVEAKKSHYAIIESFGSMLSGQFHKTNIQKIVVFKTNPAFGSEKESDIVETIIPGEPAYVTGYFSQTNKTAKGLPSLVWLQPNNKMMNEPNPWNRSGECLQSMYNGQEVKDKYLDKAYFVFNLFPDISSINYSSHIQYFPHLNFLKWLQYQPAEILNIRIKYGRNYEMATGIIKIDLSGNNKVKLKEYTDKLIEKHLVSVTFPDMYGCKDGRAHITNFVDLSKYGKVLKVSLAGKGNIMKPWPNDNQIDWNTAGGFAAVEKSSGKVEIIPLEFRKRPGASKWKWWSIGSIPGLYPLKDGINSIEAVKKLELGYEIKKENINKCSKWYRVN